MNNPGNRAVSAIFRAFGGMEPPIVADAKVEAARRGMHRGETLAYSVLVPLTVCVAVAELMMKFGGTTGGLLLTLPMTWVALNALLFVLGGNTETIQWRLWSAACLIWAAFHHQAMGITGFVAWVWIAIGVLTVIATLLLGWQASMRWAGTRGMVWRIFVVVSLHLAAVAAGWYWGWPWGVAACALIAALVCIAILTPGCQWLGPVYRSTNDRDSFLITIDDGPDPHDTPLLLDLLDEYQTKAIFFMIGEKVRAYPELAREVIRRGHEIGNHTLTHPHSTLWSAGPGRTRREIEGCQKVIEEVTGVSPRWYRAPVGHRNLFTHPVVHDLGMNIMAWNRRGYDAVERNPEVVLKRILPHLTVGDIVLLHEGTPIAETVVTAVLEAGKEAAAVCARPAQKRQANGKAR